MHTFHRRHDGPRRARQKHGREDEVEVDVEMEIEFQGGPGRGPGKHSRESTTWLYVTFSNSLRSKHQPLMISLEVLFKTI
jgi:hypothetical protein